MWSMLKFFFRKESVVGELKNGALLSSRVRDFLLFTLLFTTILRLISGIGGVFGKIDPGEVKGLFIAGGVVVFILLAIYFVVRFMLLSFYATNGGDQGQHFLERLVTLGISAMVRITPFCLGVGFLLGFLFSFFPGQTWVAALMGFGFLALMIGVMVWAYFDIKDGLKKLSA
jgi:hypothetical protein